MNIESFILPQPLTSLQARQAVNLMKRMESERAQEEAELRERVDVRNLHFYVMNGDLRQ